MPFVVINHFDNRRYSMRYIRKQVTNSAGNGGVSNINIPAYLRFNFTNLSDAIDTEFFRPENGKPIDPPSRMPIVFLPSRITPGKGHYDVVNAIMQLKAAGVDAKLICAGYIDSAVFKKELEAFICESGIADRVVFLGQLNQVELRNSYASSDTIVLPSYSEGLARVLLEAQAMGKPVIGYDVGGVPEAIRDGDTGFIVPKGDVRQLADRIAELLADGTKRVEMGLRGREFVVNRFDLSSLAARHEEFYLNALKSSPNQ